jgi:aspartyl-tRNA(Asn)/glutamyl-tRNA(Gln) amidotransferase subunit C
MSNNISAAVVAHIALLANLEVSSPEQQAFAQAFSETLEEVAKLNTVDTKDVEPTNHVTGLKNIWRADEVDTERLITQSDALSQAAHSHRGFVVVDRVLEEGA